MKKLKLIIIILLLPFIAYGIYSVRSNFRLTNTVQAFGRLTATYLGVPLGSPIFSVTNMFPNSPPQIRTIKVKNDGKNTAKIFVEGVRKGPSDQNYPKLETILDLQIKEGNTVLYTGKLSKFFEDSKSKKGVELNSVKKGQTKEFDFKVTFPSSAGNEYQNKSVIFDITFNDGTKVPHDNREDEKHPDEGNDDKGHNYDKNHPSPTITPIPKPTPTTRPNPSPTPKHDDDRGKPTKR